jgi:hypothetical protein
MGALGKGKLNVSASEFAQVENPDILTAMAGYEFWKPGAFAAAVEAWSPCLPRRMRNWDADGFAAALQGYFDRKAAELAERIRRRNAEQEEQCVPQPGNSGML